MKFLMLIKEKKLEENEKNFILVLFLILIGSSNPVAIKYALNSGWTPMILGAMRMGFIGIFVYFWLKKRNESILCSSGKANYYSFLAALMKGLGVICFYFALSLIPAYRSIMLSAFSPVVNLFLIHILLEHEKVKLNQVIGIVISFAGVIGILGMNQDSVVVSEYITGSNYGDLLMVISIIFHNTMVIFEKKALIHGANPRQLIISNSFVSMLVFSLFIIVMEENINKIPLTLSSVIIYIYLISIAGVLLFNYRRWLVARLDVSYINSFSHLGKAVAFLYAVFLLKEDVSWIVLVFFLIVLSGTWIATRKLARKELANGI